jgi:hypothetical protein
MNRESDDQKACDDTQPFPAQPFLETAPQRGQHSMHSSSRRGGNALKADRGENTQTAAKLLIIRAKSIRQKSRAAQLAS